MAKIYIDNNKLLAARNKIFSSLDNLPSENIHDVLKLVSGDFLPKSKIQPGKYRVYGGGGFSNEFHNDKNVSETTLGIGRVGARCGCVFKIEPNSWITDNALYSKEILGDYSLDFIIHWLNYKSLNQYANTSAQPVIGLKRISSVTIPKIEIEEQNEIADILTKIENNIPIENDKWGVLKQQKAIDIVETLTKFNTDQSNYLSKLRQAILQEAIEGKLTVKWRKKNPVRKGDPNYDAEALLAKIKEEKEKLIAEGKIKKQKSLAPIKPEEIPFELPDGWVWTKLGAIAEGFQYGSSSKSLKTGKIPVLRMGNIQNGEIVWDDLVYTNSSEDIDKYSLKENDILFNRTNSRELVGKTGLLKEGHPSIFAGYLVRFSMLGNIAPFYANYVMNSKMHREWCNQTKVDALGQSNINATKLRDFYFPLASLEEQKEILKKIESFFPKIYDLENHVNIRKGQADLLMQTVLREAFEG